MINPQNLLAQILTSSQPYQAIASLLNPQQLQLFNTINNKPSQEQAEAIAQMCNQYGITKNQYAQMVNLIKGNKN